jgi:hypothetical protein
MYVEWDYIAIWDELMIHVYDPPLYTEGPRVEIRIHRGILAPPLYKTKLNKQWNVCDELIHMICPSFFLSGHYYCVADLTFLWPPILLKSLD